MSKLVIEICRVEKVERHPSADRLSIATIRGWKTCINYNPTTGQSEFKEGNLCVYFPPDSVLPAALANSPHKVCKTKGCELFNKPSTEGKCPKCGGEISYKHGTPGRTGAMDYCSELPIDEITGIRPAGGRVKAARLRGVQSFGFIMKIDPEKGDDPNWTEGTDVSEHFGVTKWEPPVESEEGDAAPPHPRFHTYTDIEHWANFPTVIPNGEEVVITEKIHGCLTFDTKIMLVNGEEKEICNIEEGDLVVSWSENEGKFIEKPVLKKIKQSSCDNWIKLTLENNREICCTKDHLILTINRGWVEAENLLKNDDIMHI